MAGLLGDVLPWAYSQGDRAKRYLGGLLSDPIGSLEQTAGQIQDYRREDQRLNAQAFADPGHPFRVTNRQALGTLADRTMAGPMGFAPAGITAWHGSPHVFDAFNHAGNLGRGDGFQAQGLGTYLAEHPQVATTYAKPGGNLYKVDLPDEVLPKMLDFGSPITSQRHLGENLNPIIAKYPDLKESWYGAVRNGEKGQHLFDSMLQRFARELKSQGVPPGQVYEQANRMTTQAFKDAGISGFKYPDAGSRGGPGGTSNYVVFDDGVLKILERNGQPLK